MNTQVIKKDDYVLIKNEQGEYHFNHSEFNKLGEKEAIKFAEKEIAKKSKSSFGGKTINFEQARDLGFCEFGIKDFCNKLRIDVNKEYEIEYLNKKLTLDALKEYRDECIKLFGDNTLKYFGGVKGILSTDTVSLVLRKEFIDEKKLHVLSVKFAESVLHFFEDKHPKDDRPRKAIDAKKMWIEGKISEKELYYAADAARAAAYNPYDAAAYDAACAAADAADAAAYAADYADYAADYAADAAARAAAYAAAAYAAEREKQVQIILEVLGEA